MIHGGVPDARKEAQFRDAMFQLEMPSETRIVWSEGEPAGAIVAAAEKEGVDLLIAGALEGKDVSSRSFLGASTARHLESQRLANFPPIALHLRLSAAQRLRPGVTHARLIRGTEHNLELR